MPSDNREVRLKLNELRDSPAGTQNASADVLVLVYKALIQDDNKPKSHWFCSCADQLTIDAATFLIRLHAYNSERVTVWRSHMKACLLNCASCVAAFQESKITSRHTFFGAFKDDILEKFYHSFSDWETKLVLESLAESKIDPTAPLHSRRSLSDAPSALTYLMLSNTRILVNSQVMTVLQECTPSVTFPEWPSEAPPVGLLLLLMHDDNRVRTWTRSQIGVYKKPPIPSGQFLPMYVEALEMATKAVGSFDTQLQKISSTIDVPEGAFPFTQDLSQLWSGYGKFVRFVPPERFRPSELFSMDLRHIVIGHLSDPGSHLLDVLRCFLLILHRIGPEVWQGESADYPLVVFNAIKDNASYIESVRSTPNTGSDPWTLAFLNTYLKSLDRLPAFKDTFPVMMLFLCEELQHERFQYAQPSAISVASKLLFAVMSVANDPSKDTSAVDLSPVWDSWDIHATRFVAVAFGKAFTSNVWKDARAEARRTVEMALTLDTQNILMAITHLSIPSKYTNPVIVPRIRDQLWKKLYENVHYEDVEGIAMIFHILTPISHIDALSDSAFADVIKQSAHTAAAQKAFTAINRALGIFRGGFSDAVSRILDFSSSAAMVRLLRQATVTQDIMTLMFSPIEDIRQTAQAVAGFALDVETRQDCFRALLAASPNHALNGMSAFLRTFADFARTVPEACSVSKSLALCFTDIIDVMCSSPDGLLLKETFIKSIAAPGAAVELPKWWGLMTNALSIIFLRTPRWAVHFENAAMVEWMRDALIFGRDLLAQRKVIETGALGPEHASLAKRKMSKVRNEMVANLQNVLQELTRWLRLTDEELLFQSFALLQSLLSCFLETQNTPYEATLQKLQKHVSDARKKDPQRPQTRLDAPRLARLQEALSSFEHDDDVEEIPMPSHFRREPQASSSKHHASEGRRRVEEDQSRTKAQKSANTLTSEVIQPRLGKRVSTSSSEEKELDRTSLLPKSAKSVKTAPTASSSKPQGVSKVTDMTTIIELESSAESESDGEEGGLASLAKMQRSPMIKKPAERRQVKMMDLPTNGKNPALERLNRKDDARRTGLRLKPDISALHRKILSWDYNHAGPSPPDEQLRFTHVPDTFTDIHHYRRVFEPLLLSECWAQIQQSKDEPQEKYECTFMSRQYTDDWSDLEGTIQGSVKSDWYLSDTDIVLLTTSGSPKNYTGKVQSYKTQMNGIQLCVRLLLSSQDAGPQLNAPWQVSKVISLTTLHREYAALMGLPYYDLLANILQPELSVKAGVRVDELRQTMSTYKLNEPQAKAILNSMNTDGFSLIQGPPGTGKTSTICGLVQLFITRRPVPATAIYVGRTSGPADREPPKKILLCAPSNAAIDEITYRLKEGVTGAGHKETVPKVVRVGAPKSMHASIKDVSLDSLVDQKLNSNAKTSIKDAGSELALLRAQLEAVREKRSRKLEEITNTHDNSVKTSALEEEMKGLNKQRLSLTHQIDSLRDKRKSDARALDAIGRRCRYEVLQEADVICSTLAGAGHELLEAFDFEMVVIDEAAQSIELSALIPLKYRCNRCVMVGDPQQLPPTVISQEASKFSYNQSLFVRLQKRRPDAVHLLSIQYRMHPDISRLPSNLFYEGKLLDGPDMAIKTQKPWHKHDKFGPYRFYNITRGQEQTGSNHSLVNRIESQVAVALYARLIQEFTGYDFDYKIGVVTMYRAQVAELKRAFQQKFGINILSTVDFNTVDGFQGQEKEVIILSCVRAGPGLQNVGFLSDVRRMNVALTRAKSSVFVLGHAATLERSDTVWRNIIVDARHRSCLVDTDVTFFTAASAKPMSQSTAIKPPKPASKAAPLAHVLPPDLLTPRELAVSGHSQNIKGKAQEMSSPAGSSKDSDPLVPSPDPGIPKKRPLDDAGDPYPQPTGQVHDRPQHKPKHKRQKQAPSLFIPKKR